MLAHSALCFMQLIGKKRTLLQFQHPNYVLMLTRQNMCIKPSMTFKIIMVQGFIEIACFPYGQLPSIDVDKHHNGCPSKCRTGIYQSRPSPLPRGLFFLYYDKFASFSDLKSRLLTTDH